MAIIGGTQFLERLQFFNGQRLQAPDLQDLEAFHREMRWLHNQSLHQAGVGSGYAVSGKKGDRQVTISAGYAIDACGREIVLTEPHIEPVPPVADDGNGNSVFYDLTVSYPADADLTPSETRGGICLPRGAVRLREEPNFCWIQLGTDTLQPLDPQLKVEVQANMRILLARAEVRNCQLYQPLSTVERRNARPSRQPRISCGSTDPQAGGWGVYSTMGAAGPLLLGLQIDIDTSSARFQAPPCYSAHIVGNRVFTRAALADFPGANAPNPYVLDGFVDIAAPTATGFTLRLIMPDLENELINPAALLTGFNANGVAGNQVLAGNNWSVLWMGVES